MGIMTLRADIENEVVCNAEKEKYFVFKEHRERGEAKECFGRKGRRFRANQKNAIDILIVVVMKKINQLLGKWS